MALRWYYSVDAATVLEITTRVRIPVPEGDAEPPGVGAQADAGAGWEGDIEVDDPAGDLIMLQYRRIYAVQDSMATGSQVVGNWFISNLKVKRMDPFSSAARRWTVRMADENSLLSRRKFVGSDANRPAETDITRLRWALTTTELNVLSPDETYIDTTGPVDLDAADLRTQGPEEMMMSLMQASGKHYWIKYEEAAAVGGDIVSSSVANPTVITTTTAHGLTTGQTVVIAGHTGSTPAVDGTYVVTVTGTDTFTIPLNVTTGGTGGTTTTVGRYVIWYANQNTSELYTSTVSLSNDTDIDVTGLIYPLSDDAELDRAGGRMASGLVAPYKAGWVYIQDTDVGDTYAYVDRVAPAPNVATSAKATAQVTRQLAELALPDDEITDVWTVEGDRLNLIMHGMRVPVHATHFPNYTSLTDLPGYAAGYVYCRVMERRVEEIGPTTFRVFLRLSPQTLAETVFTRARYYFPIGQALDTDVRWETPGEDGGASGQPVIPLVGAIEYGPVIEGPQRRERFIIRGSGQVDAHVTFSYNYIGPSATFTWSIRRKSGATTTVMVSGGETTGTISHVGITLDAYAIDVIDGDEIVFHFATDGGTVWGIPAGDGHAEWFEVFGDLVPTP